MLPVADVEQEKRLRFARLPCPHDLLADALCLAHILLTRYLFPLILQLDALPFSPLGKDGW